MLGRIFDSFAWIQKTIKCFQNPFFYNKEKKLSYICTKNKKIDMKRSIAILAGLLLMNVFALFAQGESKSLYPFYIGKDYVVVGVSADTSDKELLEIRKNILKYSSIRFTEFDVIRSKSGKIQFLSIRVDCRDGYNAYISHSFEDGDKSVHGFIRDYTRTNYDRAFYYGDLTSELSGIERVSKAIEESKETKN